MDLVVIEGGEMQAINNRRKKLTFPLKKKEKEKKKKPWSIKL